MNRSIHHFIIIEKEFLSWQIEMKKIENKNETYPDLIIQPPKDDIVNYSDNW